MKLLVLAAGLLGAVTLSTQCYAQIFDDPFSQYVERSVTITPGVGNDQGVNAAIQTIDPWPPYAGYTRIPARGEHAVDSIVRLNKTPEPFQGQQGSGGGLAGGGAGSQTGFGSSATGGGGGSGGGGSTPMQPISGQ